MIHSVEEQDLFLDELDRRNYLDRLCEVLVASEAFCFAWALMSNHVHLVIETGSAPLCSMMQRVNAWYARRFNRRHGRTGRLLWAPYHSLPVEDDAYLAALVSYVHLNPVRSPLVADLDALAGYPWSGHAALLGQAPPPFQRVEATLPLFGRDTEEARACLLHVMRMQLGRGQAGAAPETSFRPLPGPRFGRDDPLFADSVHFIRRRARAIGAAEETATRAEYSRHRLRAEGWTLARIVDLVAATIGCPSSAVWAGDRRRNVSRARRVAAYLAVERLGMTRSAAARQLGVGPAVLSRSHDRAGLEVKALGIRLPEA